MLLVLAATVIASVFIFAVYVNDPAPAFGVYPGATNIEAGPRHFLYLTFSGVDGKVSYVKYRAPVPAREILEFYRANMERQGYSYVENCSGPNVMRMRYPFNDAGDARGDFIVFTRSEAGGSVSVDAYISTFASISCDIN